MNDEQLNILNKWQMDLEEIKKELVAKSEEIDNITFNIRDFISNQMAKRGRKPRIEEALAILYAVEDKTEYKDETIADAIHLLQAYK